MSNTKNSSSIELFSYDPTTQLLLVTFKRSMRTYQYSDVPQTVVDKVLSEESLGKAFNTEIAYLYDSKEIC